MSAARRPRRPAVPTSARDLAMLQVAPIDAAPLPRVHVGPRQAAGTLRVFDRSIGGEVLVYTPTFKTQFDSGHRSGRWYVRPVNVVGGAPCSVAFATAREAIDAVSADAWRLRVFAPDAARAPLASGRRPKLRVYWQPTELRA